MMAVNVYHACIVGIFTTRLRHLFVCGPRRAKNNSSRAAFRCAMARESDRAPQIRTTGYVLLVSCQLLTCLKFSQMRCVPIYFQHRTDLV